MYILYRSPVLSYQVRQEFPFVQAARLKILLHLCIRVGFSFSLLCNLFKSAAVHICRNLRIPSAHSFFDYYISAFRKTRILKLPAQTEQSIIQAPILILHVFMSIKSIDQVGFGNTFFFMKKHHLQELGCL